MHPARLTSMGETALNKLYRSGIVDSESPRRVLDADIQPLGGGRYRPENCTHAEKREESHRADAEPLGAPQQDVRSAKFSDELHARRPLLPILGSEYATTITIVSLLS